VIEATQMAYRYRSIAAFDLICDLPDETAAPAIFGDRVFLPRATSRQRSHSAAISASWYQETLMRTVAFMMGGLCALLSWSGAGSSAQAAELPAYFKEIVGTQSSSPALLPYPAVTVDMGQQLARLKSVAQIEALWLDYVLELSRGGARRSRPRGHHGGDRHPPLRGRNARRGGRLAARPGAPRRRPSGEMRISSSVFHKSVRDFGTLLRTGHQGPPDPRPAIP
jgi:hypothetical protein